MERTKDEIVAELYTLRAGLSVISQNADEVRNSDKAVKYGNKEYERLKNEKSELYKQCESRERLYRNAEINLNSLDYQDFYKKEKERYTSPLFLVGVFILPILSLLSATFSIPYFVFHWHWAICLSITLALIIGAIFLYRTIKKRKISSKAKVEYDKELLERTNELRRMQDYFQEARGKFNSTKNQLDEYPKQLEKLKNQNKEVVSQKLEETEILEKNLDRQFKDLISQADWQNIDLIIFYMQTGRAENLKEALQQVDRQRQTDAIVNTIRQANASICNEIRNGFKALGTAMVQCFNLLSRQLAEQHSELMESQRRMEGMLTGIGIQNEKLLSAQRLNNALQAKANLTSDALKTDLEFMQYRLGLNYY